MSSGSSGERRFRFDAAHASATRGKVARSAVPAGERPTEFSPRLTAAIDRTRSYLLEQQHREGFWVGELEGDTILESEYLLLLAYLGRGQSDVARRLANYIFRQQLADGGWAIYPGGPLEISASVKAYLALKIAGHDSQEENMVRARIAIRAAGGAERVNSFTRYYLALLGIIAYDKCPAVPPEIMFLPPWMPFNIYEMSAWSRTILVPLSLLWAYRPQFCLPAQHHIRELFLTSPEQLSASMGSSGQVDALKRQTLINWDKVFRYVDRGLKLLDRLRIRPFRKAAVRRAAAWMQERFAGSDGLGAIFPPIIWSVIALKCLGHDDESPDVLRALNELEKLMIHEGDTIRLEPCKSPVWDTAIATIALREAGVPADDPAIAAAVNWLLAQEIRERGDWSLRQPSVEPSGWCFEFNNRYYPDVDDTSMVVMALSRSLPNGVDSHWRADFRLGEAVAKPEVTMAAPKPNVETATVVSRLHHAGSDPVMEIERMRPMLAAIGRGARWVMAMQNRDGGWGAFDRDNDRDLFTRVPFADHNAMIDPSTADLTARMLEMYAGLGMNLDHSVVQRAVQFLWKEQESDHCWFGRWGVNFIYGTWQTLVGLTAIGVPTTDPRVRHGVEWLKSAQQECGGWGETPRSYDDPTLRGKGVPTASQTAWALMGLVAGGEVDSPAVEAGVQFLLDTQRDDGTWDEDQFTGTGFPRVFYLKYHMYRIYFPLMALARIASRRGIGVA